MKEIIITAVVTEGIGVEIQPSENASNAVKALLESMYKNCKVDVRFGAQNTPAKPVVQPKVAVKPVKLDVTNNEYPQGMDMTPVEGKDF